MPFDQKQTEDSAADAAPFGRIAIAGVGLLGASLGLALRGQNLCTEVVGVGRNAERLEMARKMGALDRWTLDLQEGCEQADMVVLCGPVSVIIKQIPEVLRYAPADAIVTDVGSTKRSIVAAAAGVENARAAFVGSHPMAGSEKSSAIHAQADLYEGATVVLTPDASTKPAALERMRDFWTRLGMQIIELPPERHDEMLAQLSHLPHLVAVALVEQITRGAGGQLDIACKVAGPGFRDTTRIAKGSAEMWADIFLDNDRALLASITRLEGVLADLRQAIAIGDRDRIVALLESAAHTRAQFDATDDQGR